MFEGLKLTDFVQLAGFVIGGIVFILIMKADIKMLAKDILLQGNRIDAQAAEIKQLTVILKDQAVMQERMNAFDRQLEEMRHGRGFVIRQVDYPNASPSLFDR